MIKVKVTQPRCAGRDCCEYVSGSVSKKVKGVFLKSGCRYCIGGKRARQFKSSDPKIYVPSWCPLHKTPATLRIYCYKDSQTAFLRFLMQNDDVPYTPSGYEYAVRYKGTTERTARELDDWDGNETLAAFLSVPVHTDEVIEIDDGLTPYYFYVQNCYSVCCIPFNGERARQNKLEDTNEQTEI